MALTILEMDGFIKVILILAKELEIERCFFG